MIKNENHEAVKIMQLVGIPIPDTFIFVLSYTS